MTTQEELNAAATDALALTSFMTASAGTQTLNSAGVDIGTLEDLKESSDLPHFANLDELLASTESFAMGSRIAVLSECATFDVVDLATQAHAITAGGARLVHPDGPYVIAITGQSNAAGANSDGPNPASSIVRIWDGVTSDWGSSDRTLAPLNRSNPDGNMGNNNYALARAHRVAKDTGRPVFVIFDAQGGQPISEWVGSGTASPRYAGLASKIGAAFASPVLSQSNIQVIDELIFAQGEADFNDDFATYLGKLDTFRTQIRAESWCEPHTPIYMMSPSDLHDRYQWRDAMAHLCSQIDTRCIFVSSNGLRTDYSVTGSGDFTHLHGESLWEAGYTRIAESFGGEGTPTFFYGRGTGPADATDETAMTTFRTLISRDSWTSEVAPNGPGATGSISWGYQCVSDGNYTYALGYECETDNVANYGIAAGRALLADSSSDYFAVFGYQNTASARYTLVAGRGHTAADEGTTILGKFSEYTAAEGDPTVLQVGVGDSSSTRSNALTIRKSGRVEMKGLPSFADQTAALAGGLDVGNLFATPAGDLKVVV